MARQKFGGVTDQGKAGIQRLDDAKSLQRNKRWRGAMYLAGYSVECLLKKKLMIKFGCHTLLQLEEELRRRRRLKESESVFSHSLESLFRLAGGFDRARQRRETFAAFNVVNEWVPAWRYSPDTASAASCEDFVDSVEAMLEWINNNVG
ncbi:MAG: hypothetical protein ACR2FY_10535 [Pirellulaceae bacterium]